MSKDVIIKTRKMFKKNLVKNIKKAKRKKSQSMSMNDTEISLNMKSKSWLVIEKDFMKS